ncbi:MULTISPECIES: methyl-accepting chemotaxis protein [unclassified Rhizobium]|uniref:methyl-accepting chemotaxis protein n=1 Tax=unclassified Rhizobium TaxID=2613769 RepID=UPI000EA96387|nr:MULTISPECIES: methyl-accepting chemotaxis protein [unclassified Rhizobium]AYG68206.1 methyl-accepting chemotaxis protein [Rhizobium sp. CCGE531]AYG74589.1 methyl-accepting chemotaxis protein [Rhizobium sp. CCGE532]
MFFIDRLLQGRRIVTKVLIFVVPLVVLIAGVGLAGYHTANILNGHMTVTRATIENISDFENLQAALQEFTASPSEETRQALTAKIDAQEQGVHRLSGLLSDDQRAKIVPVGELAAKMRTQQATLWAIRQKQDGDVGAIQKAVQSIEATAKAAGKQIDIIRKDFSDKETFAKELLYDAAAYKGLSEKMSNLRIQVQMAADSTEEISDARTYADAILKQVKVSKALVSKRGAALVASASDAADKLDAVLKGSATPDQKVEAMGPILQSFVKIEGEMTLQSAKNSDTAADRFVSLDKIIDGQKELLDHVDQALGMVDRLTLHASRMENVRDAASRDPVLADLKDLQAVAARISELGQTNATMRDFAAHMKPLIDGLTNGSADLLQTSADWKTTRVQSNSLLADAMTSLRVFVAQAQELGKEDSERSANVSVIAMIVGTLLAIIGGLMLVETLRGPLKRVAEIMTRLASGDLEVAIDGRNRGDEIGDMVRSVSVFRDAALENVRLEREAESARALSAEEASRRAAERARIEAEQKQALNALADVLAKLADGNLEEGMREDLSADFVEMAFTYNHAVEALRETLTDVRYTAEEIKGGTGNLAMSADDLARRTEQQAAALEESSRALRRLSDLVRSTADRARQTATSVNETQAYATQSGEVVAKAVGAMSEINRSSEKIATIIGVIDEIAFQTNLLALNAGVEAARAGEAGRGFAVVAQEVRELAQRCANAAKEIKGLISASSAQVRNGVHLVEQTGAALADIIDHVTGVQKLVADISSATTEQSTGIEEVTRAVSEVELITQRNAAMVEENNAEIHGLRQRVDMLSEKIDRFRTGEGEVEYAPYSNADTRHRAA